MTARLFLCFITIFLGGVASTQAAQLMVGASRIEITAPGSVPLAGQMYLRLSQGAETPLLANVTALESRDGERSLDSVIFVSVDLVGIKPPLWAKVEEKVAAMDASIDVRKIVLNAIHTHTGPIVDSTGPALPKSANVMPYSEILEFVSDRIAEAVVAAWKNRKPGKMAWGLDFAVVGFNRRATYVDGRSVMYGKTNDPNFNGMEGMEDHDVGVLFFRDENDKILSVIVNVACPSQVVEHRLKMNADYWHPVREKLGERFGKDVVVLGWCSAAGDLSPHVQYRKAAIARMNKLRNLDEMQEIARKLDRAVGDAWEAVNNNWTNDFPLVHRVETLTLPARLVTKEEYDAALAEVKKIEEKIKANPEKTAGEVAWATTGWHGRIIDFYRAQQKGEEKEYKTTIHVIRLGEVAVCTNQFELFTDFGIQIKSRSPAPLTLLVQLAGTGTYLPTARAVKGGGYSAIIQSNRVGPEGGRMLVEETLKLVKELFPK